MEAAIITKLINIGNSKGIIIPKNLWKDLGDTIRLRSEKNRIIIEKANRKITPREDWEQMIINCGAYDADEFKDFDNALNDGLNDD